MQRDIRWFCRIRVSQELERKDTSSVSDGELHPVGNVAALLLQPFNTAQRICDWRQRSHDMKNAQITNTVQRRQGRIETCVLTRRGLTSTATLCSSHHRTPPCDSPRCQSPMTCA
jgi:hypothetical protein